MTPLAETGAVLVSHTRQERRRLRRSSIHRQSARFQRRAIKLYRRSLCQGGCGRSNARCLCG